MMFPLERWCLLTNIVGYCPVCKTHRQLTVTTVEEGGPEYECQSCHMTWDCMVFKPDAVLYVALVSHDDEHEIIPLRICDTAEDAKHICKLAAIKNGDDADLQWDHCDSDHTRLEGELWTAVVKNPDGQTFTYYVRPAKLQ